MQVSVVNKVVCVVCMAVVMSGCKSTPAGVDTSNSQVDVVVNQDAGLNALLDELWALNMKRYPQWATYDGVREYDAELHDNSPEARIRHIAAVEAIAQRAAELPNTALSPMTRDTWRMLMLDASQMRAEQVCQNELWNVSGLDGPQVSFPMMPVFHTIRSQQDVDTLTQRYQKTGAYLDQHMANLRAGLAQGLVASRINVERALTQLDKLTALAVDETHPMLMLKLKDDTVQADDAALKQAVEQVTMPALVRYRDMLRAEVLPASRQEVGLGALPHGAECYAVSMRGYIGDGFDADELHRRGEAELALMEAGMIEVGVELGMKDPTAAQVMQSISENTSYYASSEDQLITLNEQAVAEAADRMGDFFRLVPKAAIEVRPLEAHRAPDAPAAYYNSPPEDGSRPGIYYVNTYKPETRPLFNLRALAFHEAIPGHHLQLAIAKELPEVHIWRRNAGQTAFVEGWALYAEMLADEMNLYTTPLDRFGMYNYQAWRAVRLVLDTGLHSKGWTRQQAIDFMTAHTALPPNEIANEVDRYIAWPGQALSYMVGRMEIQSLRAMAEQALGDRFVLSQFHDVVLGSGSVPLTILAEHVEVWVYAKTAN